MRRLSLKANSADTRFTSIAKIARENRYELGRLDFYEDDVLFRLKYLDSDVDSNDCLNIWTQALPELAPGGSSAADKEDKKSLISSSEDLRYFFRCKAP